jgi:hypothetical protein
MSDRYSLGVTKMRFGRRLSVRERNLVGKPGSLQYPIQPYRPEGNGRVYAALPSDKYRSIIAYYSQVRLVKGALKRTIFPTGTSALVFRCDNCKPGAFLVGTPTFPREAEYIIPGCDYFLVWFWPSMSSVFCPVPAEEITDRSIPLDEIWRGRAEGIIERIALATTLQERVREFERSIGVLTVPEIPASLSSIIAATCMDVSWAGEESRRPGFYTERHIRRLFKTYVGISPILFRRIIRHQNTLRALLSHDQDIAGLAFEEGYYDQSHLIKEFKRFLGRTPTEFIREHIRMEQGAEPGESAGAGGIPSFSAVP